jgi:methylmalonyl-CoA/ethylmalonyl-CoA epimerase
MITLPPLFHTGIVVDDLAVAVADLNSSHGLSQENLVELHVDDALWRGRQAGFGARYAFLPLGNTQIELIQPLEGNSPYSEFLATSGEGIHHLAFLVSSVEAHLQQLRATCPNLSIELDASFMDGAARFVYVNGTMRGARIELIEGVDG